MRYFVFLVLLTFLAGCSGEGCNESSPKTIIEKAPVSSNSAPKVVDSGNAQGTYEPANEDGILFHYICPDRCVGGVLDYEGLCPVCGKTLHHNAAYHFNNNNPTATPAADLALLKPRDTSNEPAQSPNGLWHFTCPNGHDGSGVEGNCAVCGAELEHNSLYHTDTDGSDEPAQNAAGVWHFVCPDGHDGGAGAPITCDACGKDLIHNEIYHQ